MVYDNSLYDYLSNMPADHPYLKLYRQKDIILRVGHGAWEDALLDSTRKMDALLQAKQVPAWIDYWGHDVAHDWAWWRKQIVYFIDKLFSWNNSDYIYQMVGASTPGITTSASSSTLLFSKNME